MSEITLDLDGRIVTVTKEKYIKAKTKDLREFGYTNLTEEEVRVQLEKILKGEELDIIGMFMEKDIVKPSNQ